MSKKSGIELERETPVIQQKTPSINTGDAAHQQTLRNIGLVMGYEFRKRIRQRSFIISTIFMLVLVILGACVPTVIEYFMTTSSSQTKMVVVNNANAIATMNDDALSRYINTALNGTVTQTTGTSTSGSLPYSIRMAPTGSSISDLQKQVKDGTLSILLVLDRAANKEIGFTYYTNANSSSLTGDPHLSGVQALASQLNLIDKASRLGLTPAQTGNLFTQPTFNVVYTGQGQNSRSVADTVTGYILAYVGVLLIFMSVYLYGYGVATGLAEKLMLIPQSGSTSVRTDHSVTKM